MVGWDGGLESSTIHILLVPFPIFILTACHQVLIHICSECSTWLMALRVWSPMKLYTMYRQFCLVLY